MLQNMRQAWLEQIRSERTDDDQEAGLLEDIEKEDQDESIIESIQRSSFVSRFAGHLRFDREQLQDFKPAWLKPRRELKLHPTSYLDGLRGLAAFFVYIHHSSLALFPGIRPGYGALPGGGYPVNYNYLIQLPIIRVIYSGAAMVTIFFVISGYVLSAKPLRLARERQHQKLFEGLASSTFRRGPRLFIPCVVSTFVTAVVAMSGIMLDSGITRHYPKSRTGSWTEQFTIWLKDITQFVSPYAHGSGFEPNLWTIPIEFRGSLLIFLCALGVSTLRSKMMRTALLALLECYWLYMGFWELALFLGGMLVAECALYRKKEVSHTLGMRIAHGTMVLIAIYFLSMPEEGEGVDSSWFGFSFFDNVLTPGQWHHHAPPGRWWVCLSAIFLVAVIEHAGPTSLYQRALTSRFAQYLGHVSYSFYLWHGLTIFTVVARVMTFMMSVLGNDGAGWWMSLIITEIIALPFLFWISDLSTIFVDQAAVNFGKRLMEF